MTLRLLVVLLLGACKLRSSPVSPPPNVEDAGVPDAAVGEDDLLLAEDWRLHEAGELAGATVSTPGFPSADWLAARVPTTVLAAQVAAGRVADPFVGERLKSI